MARWLFVILAAWGVNAEPVIVRNPKRISASELPAERVPVGVVGDYKACVAMMPSGELLMVAFHQYPLPEKRVYEDMLLVRSNDGGKTWSKPQTIGLLGREPYLTILDDGTVFITVHLLAQDVRNKDGYTYSFVHRSGDGGRTWSTTRVGPEGFASPAETQVTRNVLAVDGGALVFGASDNKRNDYLWKSRDGGRTWDKSQRVKALEFESKYHFFGEAVLFRHKSGKLLNLVRVDSKEFPIEGRRLDEWLKGWNDNQDHLLLYESGDQGKTFRRIGHFTDYGEIYPSVLRLRDGRLLMTFTVRSMKPPLGLHAVLGTETADGFAFDFQSDRFVLDAKTPRDKPSGGGFGRTVQLPDGTLVSSLSWRGEDNETRLEVVRWKLPGE
ncbi:MAG: exo-alpha-sialidase [Bryobacteraceae bacterium]